ncbi:MAG TPA: MarR family winged helix-turn-helix transcriptional regulator [Streptosporangiaceae bacterium]|nr:MarR family winged helix-turn-helix transcriptional regulator [Streptosporangiaceae bacterium]
MANWGFLTNHARVLLCIAHDPATRLRDIAASVGITERSAYGIVSDLAEAGYIVKHRDGRRNQYEVRAHLPLPEFADLGSTVGELLVLLSGTAGRRRPAADPPRHPAARPGGQGVAAGSS